MKIQDKVVIITGASEGIGKALAQTLSAQGAKLVLAARSEAKLQALAKTLPGSVVVKADLHREADLRRVIETAIEKFGRVDILVNNAGRGLVGAVETVDLDAYKEIVDLNVYAPLRAMQLVIPHMRQGGGGLIMNISSMVSKNAYPTLGAYASTKYALNALSFTARAELAKDHIVVSVFHPKMTATRFGENAAGSAVDFSSRPGGATPMVDTAEQVAEKIVELIGTEAAESNM